MSDEAPPGQVGTMTTDENPHSLEETFGGEGVELRIAPTLHNVRMVRLLAAGVADAVGYDLDALDDLRIGVDELCALAIDCAAGTGDRLSVRFTVAGDSVVMDGIVEGAVWDSSRRADGPGGLAGTILSAVVDDFRLEPAGNGVRFSLRKRIDVS